MNMIERVARALAEQSKSRVAGLSFIKAVEMDGEEDFLILANAAISAMRKPTDAMKQAVDTAENDMGVCHAAYEQIDWETAWETAIDAALKETPNAHDR